MAVSYTWTIPTVERNSSDGGITFIHWLCTGVDGDYTASTSGRTGHEPDASAGGFISYDKVTEANCIAWAQNQIIKADVEAEVGEKIDQLKEQDKTPTTEMGVPW